MRSYALKSIAFILFISLLLNACASAGTETPGAPAEPVTLRMALLPIIDNLPMYVAQQEGYFTNHHIQVEFIPVASAAERDQVFAAGQADGMINEIVSTLLYNKDATQIQIVRFARVATPTSPQYHVLVSAKSDIQDVSQLKGVEIGISQGTIIEYVTDRLLTAEGLAPEEIKSIAVPKIADRMALLSSGELKAATLPDPLSYLAVQQGAVILLDDTRHPEFSHSTYSFRKTVIDQQPEAIAAFLAAIEEAIAEINGDPSKWDSLLSEQKLVPAPLIGEYKLSPFPTASLPEENLWDDVLAWAKGKGLVEGDVSYADSVNAGFLP